ncbi:TonB-dependent receptor [Haliea sp. E17]|uniref:TonB-dependent receptor n=1 Tax=Haliea sp. E17 TaxID=3401576 RepID=UPI003AAC5632
MKNKRAKAPLLFLPMAFCASFGGMAQTMQLEEVLVTAQLRTQSVQDVPISMVAVSGEMMESRQLYKFENLVPDLPNVEFISSPGLDKALGIRGLFSATGNPAFEQSVGVFSDNVYISRGRLYNLTFIDVERIEVLRGPQGVLNGKNSIAGAINIHSKEPTAEFEAGVIASYEFENEGYSGEAYVSGPMTDNLSGRAVVKYQETGGYLDFPRTGRENQNESEYLSFKGSLMYEPATDSSLLLRYSRQEAKQFGTEFGPYLFQKSVADALTAEYLSEDPDFDFVTNDVISNGKLLTVDNEGNVLVTNKRPEAGTDIDILSAAFDREFNNGGEFTSITSYLTYTSYGLLTQAFRPVDFVVFGDEDEDESFDQFTQELRYVSPGGETIDYLFGLYYLWSELDIGKNDSVVSAGELAGFDSFNFLPIDDFSQTTEAISVLGQVTWNITDRFRASFGLRYTAENKEADGSLTLLSTDRSTVVGGQPPGSPGFNPIADLFANNWANSSMRNEDNLDPSVIVQWDISDSGMLYASWTQATKAGGFNAGDLEGISFEYNEEEATSFEVGAKLSFLDDQLRWNIAAFSTDFKDLQVSAWDATANTFITNNAAEATIEGFESDLVYAINSHWRVGGAVGYLDAKYDDYPGASCSVGESREPDCDADNTRNAAGDELRQAPEWSANAYVEYVHSFSNDLEFGVRVTSNYSDSYYMSITNDPYLRLGSYIKTDALCWVGSDSDSWRVSLLGKNLSDERVPFFANSTPLVDEAYFASVQPGRELYLEFSYRM